MFSWATGVPILLYHAVDSPTEPTAIHDAADLSVVVGLDLFRQQLQCLRELGKRSVSLDRLFASDFNIAQSNDVVLTFDDGHRSNWSIALPELINAGAVATFYVVVGFVDKDPDYLTSIQLREMAANGMRIGSHGMSHRYLTELSPCELRGELADSRARLENILGYPVLDFALPGGHYNRQVLQAVRECGYRSTATCKIGIYRDGGDSFRLPRLEIRRGLTLEGFRTTFRRSTQWKLQALEAAKTCLRTTCGLSRYIELRRLAHQFLTLTR